MNMSSNSLFQPGGFRQAALYIHNHRGKTFVVYVSSDVLSARNSLAALIQDLALMHSLGVKLVLVLGSKALIHQSGHSNIEQIMKTHESTCANLKNLFSAGLVNTPMSATKLNIVFGDFVHVEPSTEPSKTDALAGAGYSIDGEAIRRQLDANNIVGITPLGHSTAGNIFPLTGAEVAMRTACALECEKLILMLSDFRLQDDKEQGESHYSIREAQKLANELPASRRHHKRYLDIAVRACSENVKHVHLVDAGKPGTLLQELYSLDGAATLVTSQEYDEIRPATHRDIDGIVNLIQPFIEKGVLVPRSRGQLELEVERFDVIERDGVLLTCGMLYTFPEDNVAEVGCLAVHPEYQSIGRGSKMLMHLQNKAYKAGFSKLFVLTTQTEHWFQDHGFEPAGFGDLPMKKQALYNHLRNSKVYFKTIR